MIEPARALGYGAQHDLASLYGYNLPDYQTGAELMNPAAGSTGPVKVAGKRSSDGLGGFSYDNFAGGVLGGDKGKIGGYIDPVTGTVSFTGGKIKNADKKSALLTEYLRTGVMPKGDHPQLARFIKAIGNLHAQGYKYDPNAASQPEFSPVGQPTSGKTSPPGTTPDALAAAGAAPGGTSPDGTAGNFGRFFTSPDYQFNLGEGQKALDRTAGARSGAVTGNQIEAQTTVKRK